MHIGPSLDYLERAYDDAKYGRPSSEPILEITMPTSVDATIAPAGKHILSMFVQYAPYKLAEGNLGRHQGDRSPTAASRLLARYAPNVPGAIEHRQVLSPLDLERTFGLTGGNIMQGAMTPNQLYCFRPVAGWADHRTPVRGPVSLRRRQPPRRRRDGRLRPQRGDGDPPRPRISRRMERSHVLWRGLRSAELAAGPTTPRPCGIPARRDAFASALRNL